MNFLKHLIFCVITFLGTVSYSEVIPVNLIPADYVIQLNNRNYYYYERKALDVIYYAERYLNISLINNNCQQILLISNSLTNVVNDIYLDLRIRGRAEYFFRYTPLREAAYYCRRLYY